MIVIPGEQGTPEWHKIRLGIPTVSCFERIITASGNTSAQFYPYIYECVAEWVTGQPTSEWNGNSDTERGHEFEPDARATYEWETGEQVRQVSFIYRDKDKLVGGSPDGLIVNKITQKGHEYSKGLEVKCPRPTIHVSYLVGGEIPKKYIPQAQGSMWLCDMDQWDFTSYHEDYDPLIVTVERDEKFSKALDKAVPLFIEQMLEYRNNPRFIAMRNRRIEEEQQDEQTDNEEES